MPKNSQTKKIVNRRAHHDYDVGDSIVVGLVLSGAETKSLRLGHGHLQGAYVTIKDGELWLVNATIAGTKGVNIPVEEQTRSRKLLAKQREIDQLIASKQRGQTIIPLELMTGGRFIKLRIASGRGKKLYDKRQTLRARDEKKHIQASLKQHHRLK